MGKSKKELAGDLMALADKLMALKVTVPCGVKDGECGAIGFGMASGMMYAVMMLENDIRMSEDPVELAALMLTSTITEWKNKGRNEYKTMDKVCDPARAIEVMVPTNGRAGKDE